MSKKKVGVIIGVVAAVAVASVCGLYFSGILGGGNSGSSSDKVYVEKISTIMNQFSGAGNRYSGVVEAEKTSEINKDNERTIKEVLVAVGDTVEEGTPLFTYDTEDVQLQLEQKKLELENIGNEISGYNTQISELQQEKATVPADQQFEYTTQIQSLQTSIKQAEYNKKSVQAEIDKIGKSIDNSVVASNMGGVVKSINENGTDEYGNSVAYMTILATGEFRVKGAVNEQNFGSISEGQPVLIRSRLDETITWNGTISKIDTENTISNNNNYYSSPSDESTTSTKYPFYVELESMDGLMIGQHVFIELDMGQTESKEGIWLYSYYIVQDDGDPYVWADNGKGKLEKKKVELGEYDESMDQYQIVSGLTLEDAISWPMPGLYEGVTTVTNAEEVDYSSPLYNQEGTEGGMGDGIITDDGMGGDMTIDDGMNMEVIDGTEINMEDFEQDGVVKEIQPLGDDQGADMTRRDKAEGAAEVAE